MRPLGYLYKRVAPRPDWIGARHVEDIYSLSGCVSENFADYIPHWRHNGFWLFDAPAVMADLARELAIPLRGLTLFYYEAHEEEYNETTRLWEPFEPEAAFPTAIEVPRAGRLEGFDVVTFSARTAPECSPLSCNGLAATLAVNRHCLLDTFEAARKAIEAGTFDHSEPGPFRIIAVYAVDGAVA
jgi:hypothetical protein